MLKQLGGRWTIPSSPRLFHVFSSSNTTPVCTLNFFAIDNNSLKLRSSSSRLSLRGVSGGTSCRARRRVRYDSDDEEEEDGGEDYGQNEEIAMLELYTQSARGEALLVRAVLDGEEVEVVIFKGFSSSLSHRTSADPSRSVVPGRAVIKSVDRIRGPFDPSNIQYIEKNLEWNTFKTRLSSS